MPRIFSVITSQILMGMLSVFSFIVCLLTIAFVDGKDIKDGLGNLISTQNVLVSVGVACAVFLVFSLVKLFIVKVVRETQVEMWEQVGSVRSEVSERMTNSETRIRDLEHSLESETQELVRAINNHTDEIQSLYHRMLVGWVISFERFPITYPTRQVKGEDMFYHQLSTQTQVQEEIESVRKNLLINRKAYGIDLDKGEDILKQIYGSYYPYSDEKEEPNSNQ